jgi:hypothetical protein
MIVLALLAPIAAVLSLRLSFEACLVLNPLGLPWPDAIKVVVRVLCAMILLASTAGMCFGFAVRQLRGVAIFVLIYSIFAVFPGFIAFFLTVYGDPAANCVPV